VSRDAVAGTIANDSTYGGKKRDLGLGGLVVSLAVTGVVIYWLAGLPRVPTSLPVVPSDLELQLELLVRSPTPEQQNAIVFLLGWAFWLVWAFLAGTTLLRIAAVLATRVADGAMWVRSLRWLSNLLTLPFIRRAVDTSMAGTLFLRVAFAVPSAPMTASVPVAAQVDQVDNSEAQPTPAIPTAPANSAETVDEDLQPGDVVHVVRYGESLVSISDTYYGDPDQWKQIYADNQDRPQPDHASLQDAGKIYPGWRLVIHNPTQIVEFEAEGQAWHTVRHGETLWGIADAVYGDGLRWPELFAPNAGLAYRGHVLTNPNMIQAGMRLKLLGLEAQPSPAPAEEAGPAPVAESATAPTGAPATPPPAPAPSPIPIPTVPMPVADVAPPVPVAESPATLATPTNEPQAQPGPAVAQKPWEHLPTWTPEAAGAAGGVALLGLGLAGIARSRRRRSPWDETDIQVIGGFAQATGDETAYEDQAAALSNQVLAFVREHGCSSVQLLGVYAGRTGAGLVLSLAAEQAENLTAAASAFGAQPNSVRLKSTDDGDYHWEQPWSSVRPRPVADGQAIRLLPIGLAGDRRVLYANSSTAGAMLVAGRTSSGVRELQAALVVDRARRQRPDELYLLTIASPARLEPRLVELPHQRAGFVDPNGEQIVAGVLEELRQELERRLEHGQADSPDVLLVVDEWAELAQQGPFLDLLARHGPAVGISILAATTRADDVHVERWVSLFTTRLVLQTSDEAGSVRLLGEAGAEDLDAVGQLWPWVQGRLLHHVRGFRMPPVHLADLVERMRERAQTQPTSAPRDSLFEMDDDARDEPPGVDARAEELAEHHLLSAQGLSDSTPQPRVGFSPANGSVARTAASSSTARPASSSTIDSTPSAMTNGAADQLASIGAVALAHNPSADFAELDSVADPQRAETEAAEPLVELYLFGNQASLVRGLDVTPKCAAALSKYRRGWSLFLAIAALPASKASATAIGALVWPATTDDLDAVSNRLRSNLANARQILRSAGLSDAEARRVLRTEGGMCLLDRVRVDVRDFLSAERAGNRAWAADRHAEAIGAYQQARALYVGPLLKGQEAGHPWLTERVDGGLTLIESYHTQWREISERLANLYERAGRHSEAAAVYRDLLVDQYALPSRDRDLTETRESHARRLFACCCELKDVRALEQAFQDLSMALERDDVDGASAIPTRPGSETLSVLAKARQELRPGTPSVSTSGSGGPPAAAGD